MNIRLTSLCVFLLLFAAGCQSTGGAGQGAGQAAQQATAEPAPAPQPVESKPPMVVERAPTPPPAPAPVEVNYLDYRTLYFDFDRSDLRPEYQAIIEAHARFLAENPGSKLRLEGHADERGSREYNIGLGERRAQTVRRALSLQGASSAQLSTLSYGEEKPAVMGHDEYSWQQNRRVELVYH
ncbi:MAG: peptidoglycan-associated lipoprotein Pal [Gammaproteobacteria bacterium]|nr:peptidoglycan-associated lipoprotein Pal [Gammaproteobacteria bacterium]